MELTVNGRRAYAYTGGRTFDPKLPAVVFIHGGAWIGGDRSVYESEIREHASKRGYAAASIDYRLMAPDRSGVATQPWPAQIEDVRCAIRFAGAAAWSTSNASTSASGRSDSILL